MGSAGILEELLFPSWQLASVCTSGSYVLSGRVYGDIIAFGRQPSNINHENVILQNENYRLYHCDRTSEFSPTIPVYEE